ncbi:hypothetical protein ONZ45_g2803 [Pleurotus djamor]|nr:hypothetical protein ONZ45_g2803 [Pleurotus djamor]
MKKTVKVAVVGSGLAGLTAAYLLSREREENDGDVEFEVHLFEKAASIGMDSSSISLPVPESDETWRIDVPMRSFQGGYYPQLIELYKRLGVSSRISDFSYSFSWLNVHDKSRRITTQHIYDGASGRRGISVPSKVWAPYEQSKTANANWLVQTYTQVICFMTYAFMMLQLVFCFSRFAWMSLPFLRSRKLREMSFREWSVQTTPRGVVARLLGLDSIWQDFVANILIPTFSAVCTTGEEDVQAHPMEEFLDYMWLTLGTHHYVVENGVRDVVRRLTKCIKHIRLGTPIVSIEPDAQNPKLASIRCVTAGHTTSYDGFSHVIFATQATRAVPLLESYAAALPRDSRQFERVATQIQCIKKFEYRQSIVINHTDSSLLPDNVDDHRDLNMILLDATSSQPTDEKSKDEEESLCVPSTHTMATHVLKIPKNYPKQVYQTTNPIVPPREECILSVSKLERAVLTKASKKALEELYVDGGWFTEPRLGRLQGFGWEGNARSVEELNHEEAGGAGVPLWFCGAYAAKGIPLLEGCVVSARLVAEQIQRGEGARILKDW